MSTSNAMRLWTPSLVGALALMLALPLVSCSSNTVPVEHEDTEFRPGDPVDLGAAPWRARRRMDIDQLDASLASATGGITWSKFDELSDTLGVPDYLNSSSEDLTVSLLFVKFLDDAARDVCQILVRREAAPTQADRNGAFAPASLEDPDGNGAMQAPIATGADLDEALANLLLRFHGRQLEPGSEQLEPWRELYGALTAAVPERSNGEPGDPNLAWQGVCVALITHPDFYTY